MKGLLSGNTSPFKNEEREIHWEDYAYDTVLACHDEDAGIEACAYQLQSLQEQVQPELTRANAELAVQRNRAAALYDALYARPLPVNDAKMLTHRKRVRMVLALSLVLGAACLVGNVVTFMLFGWSFVASVMAGVVITALPASVGHLVYERLISGRPGAHRVLVLIIAALFVGALYNLGQARRTVTDKATAQQTTESYVDGGSEQSPADVSTRSPDPESSFTGSLGAAAFLITLAAELGLCLLVGIFISLHMDADYAAWSELKKVQEAITGLEGTSAELTSHFKRAQKQCMVGIRRAQSARKKRPVPYHKAVVALIIVVLEAGSIVRAQTIEREHALLIDESATVTMRQGLFQDYTRTTTALLASEPANTRIWVLEIGSDSFGSAREIVKGWTPLRQGVFDDELNRARHDLARDFERKSSTLGAGTRQTDILGALWRAKILLESRAMMQSVTPSPERIVTIFSDMENDTREFPMPKLIAGSAEQMFEHVKVRRLVVPLPHYQIYVYGASTLGRTPRSWAMIKRFWEMYFRAAGAELVAYSAECDVRR